MLQRLKEYGETVTGVRIPESVRSLTRGLADDFHIESSSVQSLVESARKERRQWQVDVVKCGLADLTGRLLRGGQRRYANSSTAIETREG